MPRWDEKEGELWYAGQLVRRFHPSACNLSRVLSAFQEEGWPPRIDDPLEPMQGRDRSARLRKVVERLNKAQGVLRFWADGSGESIRWEERSEK